MKVHCPMRKRRCRHCKVYMFAKDLEWHVNNECVNKLIKCGVENCDTWFQGRTQHQKFIEHENEHLQKNVSEWDCYELAFWFKKTFKYFHPKELNTYCQNIIKNEIYGYKIVDCEPGALDKLLEKQIGLHMNARATVMQAFGMGWTLQTKAGAFLNKYVANKVEEDIIESTKSTKHFQRLVKRSKTHISAKGSNRGSLEVFAKRKHNIKII